MRRHRLHAEGMPGFDVINPESPWLPAEPDVEQAKQLMSEVANPKTNVTLYTNDSGANPDIAVAVQAGLSEIGINADDQAAGVPAVPGVPRAAAEQGRRRVSARLDRRFVDAINFLELWTCESGNNNTNYCNEEYDALIEKVASHPGQRRPL